MTLVLLLVWVCVTVFALHEAYKWGRLHERIDANVRLHRGLFRALRDTCDDPQATDDLRTGAFAVVRKAVRR